MDGGAWQASLWGRKESDMTEWLSHTHTISPIGFASGLPVAFSCHIASVSFHPEQCLRLSLSLC